MKDRSYLLCYVAIATLGMVVVCLFCFHTIFSAGPVYAELGLQDRPALRYGLILVPSLLGGIVQWFVAKHIMFSKAPPRRSRRLPFGPKDTP
ncbi:hypothetical protein LJR168_003908 [Pseudoxanthomonas sp. LjRoot168]|uniref:hypothetical protein n=1 Tax=unclassified Pseudoxanthomonas TaxID=2645906 RepID=UPI003ECFD6CD